MTSQGKPPHRPGSPPSHPCSAPALSTLGQRGVAAITFPVRCPRCVFAGGQGDGHIPPRHTRSAASRGGPRGGFPGQRGHGAAAPCPRESVGKPFLLDISIYRGWRLLKGGRGKLRAQGEVPGDWEAAHNPGRGRRAGPGRISARILPAGFGAGAARPCPVPQRAGPPP